MPSVLAILADGFEEIETVTPIDLLRRAGVQVTTVTLNDKLQVTGRSQIVIHADACLSKLESVSDYDCLFLPGGPAVKTLRANSQVRVLVRLFASRDKWLAAICAAPVILGDSELLRGKRYTAHTSVANELTEILAEEKVVVDGKLITSRGAGTSVDFGLALVEQLVSKAKAQEIATAICV